jgi:hypothetical protein
MPKVSLNWKITPGTTPSQGQGYQKGPATDYSMLLQMKRHQVIVAEANSRVAQNGRKGVGIVTDGPHTRGTENGPANPVLVARGAGLGFFKW